MSDLGSGQLRPPVGRVDSGSGPAGSAGSAARVWPVGSRGALGLAAIAVVAWLLLPTAPNYDTATHLVWSHELLEGRAPDVDAAAAPTLHPLWLVATLIAAITGGGASLLQLVALGSLMVVVACAYRLAADVAGVVAGTIAAVSAGSSFALLLLAFKAYVDLPFLAVVLTAVVVERSWHASGADAAKSKAAPDLAMPVLMLVAGLLRPEAWAIGLLLVALRLVRGATMRQLVWPAAIVLVAPVVWALADLALTGDPLHSLTGTQALAEELGRKTGLAAAPRELLVLLGDLARPPIAAAGVLGVWFAVRFVGWRPLLVPLATLAAGAAGFLLVGALGLPLLQRYLQLPAVLLCVFAGIAAARLLAVAKGEAPRPHPTSFPATPPAEFPAQTPSAEPATSPPFARWLAIAALALGTVGALGYLALKADSFRIVGQGVLREAEWQRQGAQLLKDPAVQQAMRCGPVTLPTYRFIPELTLRADLDAGRVISRATALGGAGEQTTGVAIVIDGSRAAKTRLGWAAGVPRTTNATPPGFQVVARRGPFVAAVAQRDGCGTRLAGELLDREHVVVRVAEPRDLRPTRGGPNLVVILAELVVPDEVDAGGSELVDRGPHVGDVPAEHGVRRRLHLVRQRHPELGALDLVDVREIGRFDAIKPEHRAIERVRTLEILGGQKCHERAVAQHGNAA